MRRWGILIGLGMALGAAAPAAAAEYVPGELLVRFESGTGLRAAAVRAVEGRARDLDIQALPGLELVRLPAGASVPAAVAALEALPGVADASPNWIAHEEETIPNEPRFGQLWPARNVGQAAGFVPDADADIADAWDITQGSPNVVIAVMDGGIDYTHPDLQPNIWSNPAEPVNGADDDGNGLVDDAIGYDFNESDADPRDQRFHGTHVSGIIGAVGNNAFGTAGINWSAKLMALRVTDAFGSGPSSAIIAAMDYAGRHGVRVLNGSLGFKAASPPAGMAEVAAAYPNTLYVFAAGNDGTNPAINNNDTSPHFPSSLPGDNVISVASSTPADTLSSFSNFGPTTVDLAAPGSSTLSAGLSRRDAFEADFETGNPATPSLDGFATTGTWGPATQMISGNNESVLSDSPGGNYAPNSNTTATSPPFDLTGLNTCRVFFHEAHGLAAGDVVNVQVQVGAGAPQQLAQFMGTTTGFPTRSIPLSVGEGSNSVRVIFNLVTNPDASVGFGIFIDDVSVRCFTPGQYLAPNLDGTSSSSGTSFSAPQVSGVAALLLSKNPGTTTAQLRAALLGGVDVKPAFQGITVTGGRLNAVNALNLTPPPPPPPDTVKPRIIAMIASPFGFQPADRGASLSRVIVIRRRLPRFTTVSIRLSEAGNVAFRVERLVGGRRVGRRCLVATRARRFRRPCVRVLLLPGTFRANLKTGLNRKRFNGRLLNRKLPVGSYRLVATATDAANNRSLQRRTGFRTLAAPRPRIIRR